MKKYIVTVIGAIVFSKSAFSQDSKDSSKAKPLQVENSQLLEPEKKNELSIDLIPLIKWASISQGLFDVKGTLQYKRRFRSHLFFRFGVTGVQERVDREYTNIRVRAAGSSQDAVTYTGTVYKPQLHLNTGLEYRWGKRRIKQFAGVDVGYVRKDRVYTDYVAYVPKYSNYDPNHYSAVSYNAHDSTALFNNGSASVINSFSQTINGIAISPFYGVQFHFTKRFFFSLQVGLPLQFNWVQNKYSYPVSDEARKMFNIDFGDNAGGILNNFSLGFRF